MSKVSAEQAKLWATAFCWPVEHMELHWECCLSKEDPHPATGYAKLAHTGRVADRLSACETRRADNRLPPYGPERG